MTSPSSEQPQIPDSISSDALGSLLGAQGSKPVSPALRLGLDFGSEASPLDLSVAFEQIILANGDNGCTLAQILAATNHLAGLILEAMLGREQEMVSEKAFDMLKSIAEIRLCCEILDRLASRVVAGGILYRTLPQGSALSMETLMPLLAQPVPPESLISRSLLNSLGLDADAYYAYESKP